MNWEQVANDPDVSEVAKLKARCQYLHEHVQRLNNDVDIFTTALGEAENFQEFASMVYERRNRC